MNSNSLAAINAKQNTLLREQFIRESHSFLVITIFYSTHKIVNDKEDVFSIAQMALNEAIDSYDPSQGEFKTFASLIIKRRLIDYLRSQEKFKHEIPSTPSNLNNACTDSDGLDSAERALNQSAIKLFQDSERKNMLTLEIREAENILKNYGFTLFDIADASPKSAKTKEACKKAVLTLLKNGNLYRELDASGKLPMKELEAVSNVKIKILERHRRYIIAAAVILAGDFPLLSDYLDYIRKELRR